VSGCRTLEGYAVLYFGPATFKIARLLFTAVLCIHIFACLFYRVKKDGAEKPEDVEHFYHSRNADPTARTRLIHNLLITFLMHPTTSTLASRFHHGHENGLHDP
jgi:hypothetical protein